MHDPWTLMSGYNIECLFTRAKSICPPDEYDFHNRQLLHAVAEYIIKKEREAYGFDKNGNKIIEGKK